MAFVLPQSVVLTGVYALIIPELSNNRNIQTYPPTYIYICVRACVCTIFVDEVVSYSESMIHVKYIL